MKHLQLLDKFLQNQTSKSEEEKLLNWFYTHESKDEIMSLYEQRWNEVSDALSSEIQMSMLYNIRDEIKRSSPEKRKKAINYKHQIIRYVASACIIIGLGLGIYLLLKKDYIPTNTFTIRAEKGQKASMELPDGTIVWLNSDTRLSYDNSYNSKNRIVKLDGEAYFEVAKDENMPFIVSVNDMHIQALGTAFNVKAYASDNEISATLMTGKVKVSINTQDTFLSPNEHLSYSRDTRNLLKTTVYDASLISVWRTGELFLQDESLEEIAVLFERLYNIKILLDSDDIKTYRFTGVIKNSSLNNIFEILSLTAPIAYEIKNSTVVIKNSKGNNLK